MSRRALPPFPDAPAGPLVDIGANLTDACFTEDLDELLERARQAGVEQLLVTAVDVDHAEQALRLAAAHPGRLFATAGVHPHHAGEAGPDALQRLARLCEGGEVHAVGETGLDFHRDLSPRLDQERVFRAHLELAARTQLPLFLHDRDTDGRLFELLEPFAGRVTGVLHCFTGTAAELDAALAFGLHVGVTGWLCDERRGAGLRELAPRIPDDRLLIETDAPYLMPRNARPRPRTRRNEPMMLPWVLDTLASLRGQSPAQVAAVTTANARRLFGLPDAPTEHCG